MFLVFVIYACILDGILKKAILSAKHLIDESLMSELWMIVKWKRIKNDEEYSIWAWNWKCQIRTRIWILPSLFMPYSHFTNTLIKTSNQDNLVLKEFAKNSNENFLLIYLNNFFLKKPFLIFFYIRISYTLNIIIYIYLIKI